MPAARLKYPAAQLTHAVDPAASNSDGRVPAAHNVQRERPPTELYALSQDSDVYSSVSSKKTYPGGQSEHATWPVVVVMEPAGQTEQAVWPELGWYLPG